MLNETQERSARQAFENYRRELHQRVIRAMRKARQSKLIEDFQKGGPRLERRPDGEYADSSRRLDWIQWCTAWAACLEANKT